MCQYTIDDMKKVEGWKNRSTESVSYDSENNVFWWKRGNHTYCMNSINEKEEIELLLHHTDLEKDNLYVVFGIYHYGLLKKIIEKSSTQSRVLIIEPNEELFVLALKKFNYTSMLEKEKTILLVGEDLEQTLTTELQSLRLLGWDNLSYNINVILPPAYQCYKKFAYMCVKQIREVLSSEIFNLGNSLEDIFMGFRNTYRNTKAMATSNTFEEIKNKYINVPAIVVAAGPSLDKNIEYLKKAQGKAVILSCDACVRACENVGVVPDVVATIERVKETYEFYYKAKTFDEKTVLVAPTVAYPDIFREFKGKKIINYKVDDGPDAWVAEFFENMSFSNLGVSCANTAFRVAVEAGCNPIILIGQDLAFTDEKIHSDSTHTVFEGDNDDRNFDGNYVEDVNGGMVKTNEIYNWFRAWFEFMTASLKDRKVIDATEGGAKIKGTEIRKFSEVVDEYCVKEVEPLVTKLQDIELDRQKYKESLEKLLKSADKEIATLKKIQKKSNKYLKKLNKMFENDFDKMNEGQFVTLIQEMGEGNELITFIREQGKLGNYFQQIIKQTITHVRQIGNKLTPENVKRNIELQGNLFFMISNSCDVIIREYEDMREYIEKEENE